MTDPATTASPAPLPLLSRIIGVITSPKATFQNVIAVPRPMGVLFVVATVIGVGAVAPQFTEKGRQAAVNAQVTAVERFAGRPATTEEREGFEKSSQSVPLRLLGLLNGYIAMPLIALFFTALYWAAFNTVLGGTASFKQVLGIVTHSQVIGALGMLASLPIILATGKMNMAGPFNLGALAPMLEEGSRITAWLSSISAFTLWGFVVDAIGLGVLYKRNSRNIALTLIGIFALIMFGVASFMSRSAS